MSKYGKLYRKYVKKSGTRKLGRKFYRATGMVNPVKKGRISTTRMMKDIKYLKSVLNPEKKQAPSLSISQAIGQVNGLGFGNYYQDITPIISQGITGQTRNGVSVKLHSMCIKGQFLQQSANHYQGKIKVEIFINKGNLTTPNISDIYSTNPLTGLYDINSPRAIDTYKGFYKLKTAFFNMKQDNYSGVQGWKDFTIPLRFKNHHVKYNDDNSNNVTNGQILICITCDAGNCSTVTAATAGYIPVTAINSGYTFNANVYTWFYDN